MTNRHPPTDYVDPLKERERQRRRPTSAPEGTPMANDDGMTSFHLLDGSTPNGWAWALIGIPAALAWVAACACWLFEPHLAAEVSPLAWAMWAALGWYGLLTLAFGGWLGLLILTAAA